MTAVITIKIFRGLIHGGRRLRTDGVARAHNVRRATGRSVNEARATLRARLLPPVVRMHLSARRCDDEGTGRLAKREKIQTTVRAPTSAKDGRLTAWGTSIGGRGRFFSHELVTLSRVNIARTRRHLPREDETLCVGLPPRETRFEGKVVPSRPSARPTLDTRVASGCVHAGCIRPGATRRRRGACVSCGRRACRTTRSDYTRTSETRVRTRGEGKIARNSIRPLARAMTYASLCLSPALSLPLSFSSAAAD